MLTVSARSWLGRGLPIGVWTNTAPARPPTAALQRQREQLELRHVQPRGGDRVLVLPDRRDPTPPGDDRNSSPMIARKRPSPM